MQPNRKNQPVKMIFRQGRNKAVLTLANISILYWTMLKSGVLATQGIFQIPKLLMGKLFIK